MSRAFTTFLSKMYFLDNFSSKLLSILIHSLPKVRKRIYERSYYLDVFYIQGVDNFLSRAPIRGIIVYNEPKALIHVISKINFSNNIKV